MSIERPAGIIHIGVNRWNSLMQREQHLMLGLSQHYRILFVDPPLSILTILLSRIRGEPLPFRSRLQHLNDRLTVYTPCAFPPFGQTFSWIHRLNTALLANRIKRLRQELSIGDDWLGTSWPLWGKVFQELKPRFSYYDCSDDYVNFPGLKAGRERLRRAEEDLLRSVDLVFCSAQRLKEEKSHFNPNCHVIPNGVDPSFLDQETGRREDPADLREVRHPRIGYVGTIGEWVDIDLLIRFIRKRPDWSFVLIGLAAAKRFIPMLKGPPNLHWLGEKAYREIPGYLASFDLCLIPFKVNPFTEKIYPAKFHQYLGAGKPVVSSYLPDLEPFRPWVAFYRDAEDMETVMDREIREDTEEKAGERRRIAGENTWDRRVEAMVEILERHHCKAKG